MILKVFRIDLPDLQTRVVQNYFASLIEKSPRLKNHLQNIRGVYLRKVRHIQLIELQELSEQQLALPSVKGQKVALVEWEPEQVEQVAGLGRLQIKGMGGGNGAEGAFFQVKIMGLIVV